MIFLVEHQQGKDQICQNKYEQTHLSVFLFCFVGVGSEQSALNMAYPNSKCISIIFHAFEFNGQITQFRLLTLAAFWDFSSNTNNDCTSLCSSQIWQFQVVWKKLNTILSPVCVQIVNMLAQIQKKHTHKTVLRSKTALWLSKCRKPLG